MRISRIIYITILALVQTTATWANNLIEIPLDSAFPGEHFSLIDGSSSSHVDLNDLIEKPNATGGQFALRNPALVSTLDASTFSLGESSWNLSGWFQNASPSGQMDGAETLAGTRQSDSKFKGWDLIMIDGKLRFLSSPTRGKGSQFLTDERYDDGAWHHFSLAWDASFQSVTLLIDEAEVGRVDSVLPSGHTTGQRFAVGCKILASSTGINQVWKGMISEWLFATTGAIVIKETTVSVTTDSNQTATTYGLNASPLNGQIALKWGEKGNQKRDVYVSREPITEENRSEAHVVATGLMAGSANDWHEDKAETDRPKDGPRGWILDPGKQPLDREGGLFVYTPTAADPNQLYFAVVAEDERIKPGSNATTSPIEKTDGEIAAIPQSKEAIEDMDEAKPGLPVMLYLHPHTSRPQGKLTHLFFGDESMGWRPGLPFKFKVSVFDDHILVEPFDRVWIDRKLSQRETRSSYDLKYHNIETWWYGTNEFINDPKKRSTGRAVNYTERWLSWILDWVIENYQADPNRVYGSGKSMGTGIQRYAISQPERFASVDVLVPFFDWSYQSGREDNAKRLLGSCGPMHLMTDKGTTLADEMNLITRIQATDDVLPYIITRSGKNDTSVYWARKPAYFEAMEEKENGLIALWDQGDHSTGGRKTVDGIPDFRDIKWYTQHFAKNLSYPVFTNSTADDDPGSGALDSGAPEGFINRGFTWNVTEDSPARYQIEIRYENPNAILPISFNITLRQLQEFTPLPGEEIICLVAKNETDIVAERRLEVSSFNKLSLGRVALSSNPITITLTR